MLRSLISPLSSFCLVCMATTQVLAADEIPVITGGVGEVEQQRVLNQQENYNLKLIYTGEGGMYLSDVGVTIRDSNGQKVATGTTDGPFLLAELKPGRYTVESTTDGFSRKNRVHVGQGLKTLVVRFPVKDEQTVASAPEAAAPKNMSTVQSLGTIRIPADSAQ